MNIIIGGSIGSAIITYEIVAIFGYLTFGDKVGVESYSVLPGMTICLLTGYCEYHCNVSIVVLVYCHWSTCDRYSCAILIPPSSTPLPKLFGQGILS